MGYGAGVSLFMRCKRKPKSHFSLLCTAEHIKQDCLGQITGAKGSALEELEKRGLVNRHIEFLKAEQTKDSRSS